MRSTQWRMVKKNFQQNDADQTNIQKDLPKLIQTSSSIKPITMDQWSKNISINPSIPKQYLWTLHKLRNINNPLKFIYQPITIIEINKRRREKPSSTSGRRDSSASIGGIDEVVVDTETSYRRQLPDKRTGSTHSHRKISVDESTNRRISVYAKPNSKR